MENNNNSNQKTELLQLFLEKIDTFRSRRLISERQQIQLQAAIEFMIHENYVDTTFGKDRHLYIFESEIIKITAQSKNVAIQGKSGCVMKGIQIIKKYLDKYIEFVILKNKKAELKKSDEIQFFEVLKKINETMEKFI